MRGEPDARAQRRTLELLVHAWLRQSHPVAAFFPWADMNDLCYLLRSSPESPRLAWWLSGKESACNAGDVWETGVWSLDGENPLEEKMATHSSICAWKIPWTEEPGGLQSMGLHRVRQD